jgi:uncharacterized membrane protein
MGSQSTVVSRVAIRFICEAPRSIMTSCLASENSATEGTFFMMNNSYGWMGGGMWVWTLICVLVVVLLVVMINKVSTK